MTKHASIAIDRDVAEGLPIRPRAVKGLVSGRTGSPLNDATPALATAGT